MAPPKRPFHQHGGLIREIILSLSYRNCCTAPLMPSSPLCLLGTNCYLFGKASQRFAPSTAYLLGHTSPLFRRLNVQPLGQAAAKKFALIVHCCLGGSEQRLLEIPFWPGPSGHKNIKSYGAVMWNTFHTRLPPPPPPNYELFNHSPEIS